MDSTLALHIWFFILAALVIALCVAAASDPNNKRSPDRPYDPDKDYFGL